MVTDLEPTLVLEEAIATAKTLLLFEPVGTVYETVCADVEVLLYNTDQFCKVVTCALAIVPPSSKTSKNKNRLTCFVDLGIGKNFLIILCRLMILICFSLTKVI